MRNKLFKRAVSVFAGVALAVSLLPITALAGVLSNLSVTFPDGDYNNYQYFAVDVSGNDVDKTISGPTSISAHDIYVGVKTENDGYTLRFNNLADAEDTIAASTSVTANGRQATYVRTDTENQVDYYVYSVAGSSSGSGTSYSRVTSDSSGSITFQSRYGLNGGVNESCPMFNGTITLSGIPSGLSFMVPLNALTIYTDEYMMPSTGETTSKLKAGETDAIVSIYTNTINPDWGSVNVNAVSIRVQGTLDDGTVIDVQSTADISQNGQMILGWGDAGKWESVNNPNYYQGNTGSSTETGNTESEENSAKKEIISSTGEVIESAVKGVYYYEPGLAVLKGEDPISSDSDHYSVYTYEVNENASPAAYASITGFAGAGSYKVLSATTLNIFDLVSNPYSRYTSWADSAMDNEITGAAKTFTFSDGTTITTDKVTTVKAGLPEGTTGKVKIVGVSKGGAVFVQEDQDDDPNTVTFDALVGNGVYGFVVEE